MACGHGLKVRACCVVNSLGTLIPRLSRIALSFVISNEQQLGDVRIRAWLPKRDSYFFLELRHLFFASPA
jgi:hypothetical protein